MNYVVKIGAILGLTVTCFFCNTKSTLSQSQSFSQCVINLQSGPYTALDAVNNCLQVFRGKAVNEEFTTCVKALYDGPFTSRDANKYCQQAFENSASSAPSSSNSPTILVIPQAQQAQPIQRRTQRQCVNKMLNTVWGDIHCQFNNDMFEWRTIYLD